MSDTPNPGSDAAQAGGCICPVMDNNRGKWPPYPPDGWWQHPGCPMHGLPPEAVVVPRTATRSWEGWEAGGGMTRC